MSDHVPASTLITEAQARRLRRRRGMLRTKIILAVFGTAFLLGVLAGCFAPGA